MNMHEKFEASQRNGNLHVTIRGTYTTQSPLRLLNCLRKNYRGTGNIFIHTDAIATIADTTGELNHELLSRASMSREQIYLIGKNAMALNFPCNKVIIPPPKKARCTGCRKCSCRDTGERMTESSQIAGMKNITSS